MLVNKTNNSDEYASSERYHSLELIENSINIVENSDNSKNDTIALASEVQTNYNIKWSYKTVCGSVLFITIAMIVGILTVCLTTPKPNKFCQLNFKAVIDGNSFQHNSNPYFLATGDFNNDVSLDIVVVNSGTNNIGIFLNYGNGTFEPQIRFTTGDYSRPISVALGDFNNDTHLDIAIANYDTHNIGIFLGYGNGTFASQITSTTDASSPVSIAVGDINNDHCLDIVVTNNGTNDIGILFGYGNGSFTNQIRYTTGYDSLPCFVVINDFNNDHYLDIAVANYGTDNIGVFLGYGNGSFTTQITYSTGSRSRPDSIIVNDFNDDGHLDIGVANSGTNNAGLFFGYGNGSFASQKIYSISPGSNPHSIVIGDFNRDNLLDIAVANYNLNNISILIGYGNGSFATPTMFSTGTDSGPLAMVVGDFDNDNESDIAIVNSGTNNILLLIGYHMMQTENPPAYSTGVGSTPYVIASADLDNDGQLDLAVINTGTNNVGVFFGYGNGSFRDQITYSTGNNSHPYGLTINDLDNDHKLDILVANSNDQSVGILYGYGNGTFETLVTYFTGESSYPFAIIAADFNNDNNVDIAFVDYDTNSMGFVLGYGNRTLGNLMTYFCGVGSYPYTIAAGDFNDDNRLDIAVGNYGTGSIDIFIGFGDGTFVLFVTCSAGDSSLLSMLTIADLNKDNHLDIIVANSGTNNVGLFFGFGNGSFSTQQTYSTGSKSMPYWISIGDFNNDHALDIAVANSNTNNVGVFLGNGYGYFGNQTTYSTGAASAPNAIALDDFNKDNRLDIAVSNYGTCTVVILLGHPSEDSENETFEMTNNDYVSVLLGDYYEDFLSKTTYSTGSSSCPYSLAVGDLNNDKQMDLVVANSGNANLGIFLGYDNGSFTNEMIFTLDVDSNPQSIIADDFNKDNLLDVAVTNPRSDNIIVLLGNGNGTFSTEMTYSTGPSSNPTALASGIFTDDNYIDLVVANEGTDTIGIFFGFDYTLFSKQNPCELGANMGPRSVAIADFNNDGHLDIVTAFYSTNNMGVFLGYGNGTFASIMTYAYVPSSHPQSVAVGDFNNDDQLDITVAYWGIDSVGVILGYGNGTLANPILYATGTGTAPISVAVGDFNNDHSLDITVANIDGASIVVFLGYGNGTFQNGIIFATGQGSNPNSITVSDINNDTHLDIIVANSGFNNVGVFLGYGNGSFQEQLTTSTGTGSFPQFAVAGDFNKDGRLDLAIANYGTSNAGVLYGCGNGTFKNLQTYSTGIGSNPIGVNVGDFNNDNQLDIIIADDTSTYVSIFFGYSDGTFASISTVPVGQGSDAIMVAIGDFNNDNQLDFTIADDGLNNIGVFLASGSKPFGGQTTFFIGEDSHPSAVAVTDFNNDNKLDIAIANSGTNSIGILLGYGNRLFSNMTTYSTGDDSHPMSLATGDFNNDSIPDIVVANSNTNNIAVLIGYNNGSFSTLINYSMGEYSQPVSIAVGNFNRDYQQDIAVANFGTNNVCLLFGYGNGFFTNQTWYSLGYDSRPNWVVLKDLNNDSLDDVAVVTYGIDNIEILSNLC